MAYREPLPPDCPPDDADEITGRRIVYRLVRHNPPVDGDFRSQRAERPDATFRDVTECHARGLSVFSVRRGALRRRYGGLQGTMLCEVTLDRGAGRILATGNPRWGHHTWWALDGFDILANCRVV